MKRILILMFVISSCSFYDHTAFKFKDDNGKFRSNPPAIIKDGISISLSSIIGGGQIYQGFNNEIFIKNIMNDSIILSEIKAYYTLSSNETIPLLTSISYNSDSFKMPFLLKKGDYEIFEMEVFEHERYEFALNDSISLKVEIEYKNSNGQQFIEINTKKYYIRERGIVMP